MHRSKTELSLDGVHKDKWVSHSGVEGSLRPLSPSVLVSVHHCRVAILIISSARYHVFLSLSALSRSFSTRFTTKQKDCQTRTVSNLIMPSIASAASFATEMSKFIRPIADIASAVHTGYVAYRNRQIHSQRSSRFSIILAFVRTNHDIIESVAHVFDIVSATYNLLSGLRGQRRRLRQKHRRLREADQRVVHVHNHIHLGGSRRNERRRELVRRRIQGARNDGRIGRRRASIV